MRAALPSLKSTNSALFPTATHIDMNQFISSSSTPVPTNTSDPLVLQQPTTTEKPDVTPTPKIYSPLPQCAASRLHVGDSAFVNYETGRVGMRSEPVAKSATSSSANWMRERSSISSMAQFVIWVGFSGRSVLSTVSMDGSLKGMEVSIG